MFRNSCVGCLTHLGVGTWSSPDTWRWRAPECCGFGHVAADRSRELLRGRSLVFIGDSQTRRHMWSVVDSVGGERAVRRQSGGVVADSTHQFDERAVAVNDTIYDSQRAYHAGQAVLLNVDTGQWVMLDPLELCGIERPEWAADWRLVEALRRAAEPPWSRMRGSRYRVHFNVTAPPHRLRPALSELARAALKGWGCQAARPKDCSFDAGMQRQCAAQLRVEVTPSAARVVMGNTGDCRAAAELLGRHMREVIATGGGARSPRRRDHPSEADGRRLATGAWPPIGTVSRGRARRLAPTGGGRRMAGGRGGRKGRAAALPPLSLSPETASTLASLQLNGPVVVDGFCESLCRKSYHLHCVPSRPARGGSGGGGGGQSYDTAMRAAVTRHAEALGLSAAYVAALPGSSLTSSPLSLLTFVYGAKVETEW